MCEEASYFSISAQDIAPALKDIDDAVEMLKNPEPSFDDSEVAPKDLKEQELLIIKDALLELEGSFGRFVEEKARLPCLSSQTSSIQWWFSVSTSWWNIYPIRLRLASP